MYIPEDLFSISPGNVIFAKLSPQGDRIATVNFGNDIRKIEIYSAEDGSYLRSISLNHYYDSITAMDWSPDGTKIIAGIEDGYIAIHDSFTGQIVVEFSDNFTGPNHIAWSPNGSQIAIVSNGHNSDEIRIYNASTGALTRTIKSNENFLYGVTWSPDSLYVAAENYGEVAGHTQRSISSWRASNGSVNKHMYGGSGHLTGDITAIKWSPDGTKIATSGSDRAIVIRNVSSGQSIRKITGGHNERILDIAWSPDSTKILSGGQDGLAIVWDANTGSMVTKYEGHTGKVVSVNWTPDGKKAVTGSADKTVRMWYTEEPPPPPPPPEIKFIKVKVLPETLEPDALYFVQNEDFAESYVTSSTGIPIKIGNSDMINLIITNRLNQLPLAEWKTIDW